MEAISYRAATPEDVAWFSKATSYLPGPQFSGVVAYVDGPPLGMVGLDYWTHTAVQAHVCIENVKVLAPLWREVVNYLRSHGLKLIVGVTPSDNDLSIRLQRSLGFKEQYRQKDGWNDGVDMVLSEYRIHE